MPQLRAVHSAACRRGFPMDAMILSAVPAATETELARRVRLLSQERWRDQDSLALLGTHEDMQRAQDRMLHFAQTDAPVLITGETGTGKELFARALYLLSARSDRPFMRVNCAQYTDSHLLASELFGHRRGSFTGAVSDHRGLFEEADGGVLFFDEVAELSAGAQAMLLRALGEGEIVPVGSTTPRRVNVRVLAATNRDLLPLVEAGSFRADLYYRLAFLELDIAPLRHRGADWRVLAEHFLQGLNERRQVQKRFSEDALGMLAAYHWPGNVRELRGLVEMSHCLSNGNGVIEASVLEERLRARPREEPRRFGAPAPAVSPWSAPVHSRIPAAPAEGEAVGVLLRIASGEGTFWSLVYDPFMERELNRAQVRAVVEEALRRSNWSYKRALELFAVAPEDYLKFMDFLRHHRLKPER